MGALAYIKDTRRRQIQHSTVCRGFNCNPLTLTIRKAIYKMEGHSSWPVPVSQEIEKVADIFNKARRALLELVGWRRKRWGVNRELVLELDEGNGHPRLERSDQLPA